jgi:hypothetical protein
MTSLTKIAIDDIIADPTWLPHRLDLGRRTLTFSRFDRDTLSKATFLDNRIDGTVSAWTETSIGALLDANIPARPAPAFLLHTSYCCSTLMTRALDVPGRNLALREPEIIMGLSNAYRMASNQSDLSLADRLRDVILNLLARPHQENERVLIKPTNAANNLAPILSSIGVPIIFLYGDLRAFLASVIKKGESCRTIVRQIYRVFAMDKIGVSVIPQRDALALTDLQIAALAWRHQIEMFNAILLAPGGAHLRSLNFQMLLDRPAETLRAASDYLQLNIDVETLNATANGPVFQTDAKEEGRRYDASQRAKEEAALMDQHKDVLDLIEQWALKISLGGDAPARLPKSLI